VLFLSYRVCTRSPGKIADVRGTVLPLIHAVPLAYNIAGAESAAHMDRGNAAIIIPQTTLRIGDEFIAQLQSGRT
jgi:hypothetical protein